MSDHRVKVKVTGYMYLQRWLTQTRSKTHGGGLRVTDNGTDLGWRI